NFSKPVDITTGPDGALWFTEFGGNKIGTINPVTHGISETPVPTANANLGGIAVGPDGNLWFTETLASKVGVLTPTRALVATAEPAAVAPGAPFGLTVTFKYLSGLADTTFNGDVTVTLASHLGGATLGGTLTVAAHNGVATFTGLTIDRAGSY